MSDIDDCRKSVERLTRDRGEVMSAGNDKIAEIRARHERVQRDGDLATPPGSMAGQVAAVDAHDDRATLLAEVDRQRAEIERLLQAVGLATTTVPDMQVDIEDPVGMMQRVVAEVERLRASLKPFAALSLWPDDIGDEWTVNDIRSGYDWDETENDTKTDDVFIKRGHIRAARKALEGKP